MSPFSESFLRLTSWAAETLFGCMGMFFYFLSLFNNGKAFAPAFMLIVIATAFHFIMNPNKKIR